jgi:hypothetical protein
MGSGHWLVGLIIGVPVFIIVLIFVIINKLRERAILKKCETDADSGLEVFKHNGKYYDKVKYTQLLCKYYSNGITIEGLKEQLEEAKKRSLENPKSEWPQVDIEIIKKLMQERKQQLI